ncbi:MAG: ABC transporter ATP-binding protein, partial [Pedobacter sp.]
IAIKVENLSKAYQLGQIGTGTISRDLERWYARMRGKEDPFLKIGEINNRNTKGISDVVWSLKDINFEIEQGDAVGIIGRNGAGKSTLLKILSKVTAPTTGRISGKGRIASLLEVGTGFHPELSGRENIFLNGAILGMRKKEIQRKLEEIVDFAGIERYIDTPVKRYSSGMYVRLAFAVAAHLESEILIVDEVLAVGDAEFQKKCLGKMSDVSKGEGRTILFVSHNMGSINQLCSKAILLNDGKLIDLSETSKIIQRYLKTEQDYKSAINLDDDKLKREGNQKVKFNQVLLKKTNSQIPSRLFSIGDDLEIKFQMKFINPNENNVKTSIELKAPDHSRLANMIDTDSQFQVRQTNEAENWYSVTLFDLRLYPGIYYLSLYCGDMSSTEKYDYLEDCISFEITDGGKLTSRNLPRTAGLLFLTPTWKKHD